MCSLHELEIVKIHTILLSTKIPLDRKNGFFRSMKIVLSHISVNCLLLSFIIVQKLNFSKK